MLLQLRISFSQGNQEVLKVSATSKAEAAESLNPRFQNQAGKQHLKTTILGGLQIHIKFLAKMPLIFSFTRRFSDQQLCITTEIVWAAVTLSTAGVLCANKI